MKKFWKTNLYALAAVLIIAVLVCGCGKKQSEAPEAASQAASQETKQTQAESTTAAVKAEETEKTTEAVKQSETAVAEAAEEKSVKYEYKDIWETEYYPDSIKMTENGDEVEFAYSKECSGENKLVISYVKDKLPREVLYENTENWKQEDIRRTEGYFGGDSEWSFTYELTEPTDGKEQFEGFTAVEHNNGTLLVHYYWGKDDNEERLMEVSDVISGVLDSLKLKNHKPQEEFSYIPGTYEKKFKEEIEGEEQEFTDTIILNSNHTGSLDFQDNIDIFWSSFEIFGDGMDERYEFTVEGDTLYVKFNDDGWDQFERKK